MARDVRGLVVLLGLFLSAASNHPEVFAPDRWASECARRVLGVGRAEAADGGCCHFGGGVCGCRAGRAVCCKGGVSSCPCGASVRQEAPPVTRGPGGDEREGPVVQLSSVLFTDQDRRPPLFSLTSFRKDQNVWVWVDLHCPEGCRTQLASFGESEIALSLYWYFDPGASPVLREELKTDRALKASALPLRTVIAVKKLTPGNWIAEIGYGPDRICTLGDQRCSFRVRMTP